MKPELRNKVRRLAEAEGDAAAPAPTPTPDQDAPAKTLDDAAQNEVRSATHAVLGGTLGSKIYNSVFAGDLADMAETLAERHDVKPAVVADIMRGTMERWRYVTKMQLSDGSVVNVTCRLEVQ